MENRTHATADYAVSQFVREPYDWGAVRAQGERLRPGMQMSVYEDALLSWLIALHNAERVLEIGSFMGLTALWMARALPSNGALITLEREAGYAALARQYTAQDPRIHVAEADALAWLGSYKEAPFDALFIDGEKRSYLAYLEAALPHLRKGALIVADNTLLFGAMLGTSDARVSKEAHAAMTRFHTALADETRFHSILLPTLEGLTVSVLL